MAGGPLETKLLLREWLRLFIEQDGVLRQKNAFGDEIILRKMYYKTVLREFHGNMAYLVSEHVLHLARERFY